MWKLAKQVEFVFNQVKALKEEVEAVAIPVSNLNQPYYTEEDTEKLIRKLSMPLLELQPPLMALPMTWNDLPHIVVMPYTEENLEGKEKKIHIWREHI